MEYQINGDRESYVSDYRDDRVRVKLVVQFSLILIH